MKHAVQVMVPTAAERLSLHIAELYSVVPTWRPNGDLCIDVYAKAQRDKGREAPLA